MKLATLDLQHPTDPKNYVDRMGGRLAGAPLYWRDDQTGQMQSIILSYLEQRSTPEQLKLVIAYIQYHIHAPCWLESNLMGQPSPEMTEAIINLRKRSLTLRTLADVNQYISAALTWAIDPL